MNITMNPIRKEQSSYTKPMACNLPLPFEFGEFEETEQDLRDQAKKLHSRGYSQVQIARNLNVSRSTIWLYINDMKRFGVPL
jgi:DNA-binding NarL/FixJ family response regulator